MATHCKPPVLTRLLWVVAASACLTSRAQSTDVGDILRELGALDRPGCAIGVGREGEPFLSAARGAFDVRRGNPLTPDTVFNVGSVSKQFTALAVLLLAERGQLSLDDSVRRYVTELGPYAEPVTIRHLIHHVGGLRDYIGLLRMEGHEYSSRTTREDALAVLSRQTAANAPTATEYEYSNTGYFLLGVIIERVSGKTLADFSRQNIFSPLGMRNTRIVDRYPANVPRLACGYVTTDAGYEVDAAVWQQVGDGQVHTTVADMARWAENFRTGKVGGPRVVTQMLQPYTFPSGRVLLYAGGLAVDPYRGLATARHGGGWAGFRAHVLMVPQRHFVAAALCNWEEADPAQYTRAAADRYLFSPNVQSDARETPAALNALRSLPGIVAPEQMPTGLYRNAAAGYLRLAQQPDGARLEFVDGSVILREVTPGIYGLGDLEDEYAAFQPAGRGAPARITTQNSPQPIVYEYVDTWSPGEKLAAFAGEYASVETSARYSLTVMDGRLALVRGGMAQPLEPMGPYEFVGKLSEEGSPFTLRFAASADRFGYFTDGLRDVRFERDLRASQR